MTEAGRRYELIGRLVYGFHRWISPKRLRDPQSLPPALIERGEKLVTRYDALLAGFQEARDADADEREIDALLADVESFARDMQATGAG